MSSFSVLVRGFCFVIAANSKKVESKTKMQGLFKVKHSKQNTNLATK